jgi:4-hydroxybenzoyl-CoA thioesterase/acyl-CoA thioester hydrolase
MESAEHELLRSLGLSVHARLEDEHVSFPRVSATCNYASPARCEEVLDIAITVARIGTTSVTYEFHFTRDGAKIATGSMTAVCCRVAPGEPPVSRAIPPEIVEKLQTHAA